MKKIKSFEAFAEYIEELRRAGKLTQKRAIRLKCFDSCGYSMAEIEKCDIRGCPLWEFRSPKARKIRAQSLKSKILSTTPLKSGVFEKKKKQSLFGDRQGI